MELGEFTKLLVAILILALILLFLAYYIMPNIREAIQNLRNKILSWE